MWCYNDMKMNDKEKLSGRRRVANSAINGILGGILSAVLVLIITTSFQLSRLIEYLIMIPICMIMAVIVARIGRKWVLRIICFLVFSIGVSLVFLSQNEELISEISWDPSLLGAGSSVIAIAIAFYALLTQSERRGEGVNTSGSGRNISNSKEGYVWLEETKKYRCEYCLNFGKYHYCKTLGGIKRHIARKHV